MQTKLVGQSELALQPAAGSGAPSETAPPQAARKNAETAASAEIAPGAIEARGRPALQMEDDFTPATSPTARGVTIVQLSVCSTRTLVPSRKRSSLDLLRLDSLDVLRLDSLDLPRLDSLDLARLHSLDARFPPRKGNQMPRALDAAEWLA